MMDGMITDPQRKFLFTKMGEANVSKDDLEKSLGFSISELSKGEASLLIDCFFKKRGFGYNHQDHKGKP